MPKKMNLDLNGVTFSDEVHTDVGAPAFEIAHDWFTQADLVIRTAAAGGGTLLVEGTDYQLSEQSLDDTTKGVAGLSTRAGKAVFRKIQVINASYQTGTLYFSGKYIADSADAGDSVDAGEVWNTAVEFFPMDATPGMVLSYVSVTSFSVGKGKRRSDDDGNVIIASAAMAKVINSAWSIGDSGGAMDTGSAPANGTLHVYAIGKDDGSWDYLCSNPTVTTPGSPVMPSGWTQKRYIGSLLMRSSVILPFDAYGDRFQLRTALLSQSGVTPPTANRTLYSVDVPESILATAWGTLGGYTVSGGGQIDMTSSLGADVAPGNANIRYAGAYNVYNTVTEFHILTATAQIGLRSNSSVMRARVGTIGWIDRRMAFTGHE